MVRRGASLDANQAWRQLSGRTPSLDQFPRSLLSFNLTGVGSWPSKRHAGSILSAAVAPRVRPRSRLPRSVYFESVEMLMRRSSRHRRNLAHSVAVFRSRARCRIAKGGLRARKHDRPEGVRHRKHRHSGAPPDAAASVLVYDYWAFCHCPAPSGYESDAMVHSLGYRPDPMALLICPVWIA